MVERIELAMASQRAKTLAADGIEVRFGGLTAISDVSLTLEREEILGLIGPNGAGKTTLVNVFSGFQEPTKGRVLLDGESAAEWPPHRFRRSGIARTFQSGRLFRDMSVLDNVEVPAVNLGLNRRRAAKHALMLLDWMGLVNKANLPAGVLPYTDERRLGIARALAMAPAFALLDEPAAGMSDLECDDIMHLIAEIPKRFGCGVLLIEHNMRVVMGLCDRVHVLDGGRTIATGTPAEVQSNPTVIAAYLGTGHVNKARNRQVVNVT
jgi:branched-chain amino acid transport system ATP-binding protein